MIRDWVQVGSLAVGYRHELRSAMSASARTSERLKGRLEAELEALLDRERWERGRDGLQRPHEPDGRVRWGQGRDVHGAGSRWDIQDCALV